MSLGKNIKRWERKGRQKIKEKAKTMLEEYRYGTNKCLPSAGRGEKNTIFERMIIRH
jgi:hypothetical protein